MRPNRLKRYNFAKSVVTSGYVQIFVHLFDILLKLYQTKK